jgi:transcriptional regulator GlxA family with amidase domain
VSLDSRDLISSSGFRLAADHHDLAVPPSDLTLVIASLDFDRLLQPQLLERLSRVAQTSRAIGGVSHGSIVLAHAGLLDGYRCTSHWDRLRELQECRPQAQTTREVFCIDRDRWTSSGGTAAMDMMLALIRAQHGQALALSVANNFIHSRTRLSGETQPMEVRWRYGVRDRRLVKAIGYMEQSVESPLALSKIAALAGLSTRQLQRLFLSEMSRTPEQFYIDMRLRVANDLLSHTDDAIGDIALHCGFENPSHFARSFRATFGHRPSDVRRIPRTRPDNIG